MPSFSHRLCSVLAIALSCFFSSRSNAQAPSVVIQLDTQYELSREPANTAGLRDVQMAGLSIDAYGMRKNYGLYMFVDAHVGAGLQGGFAYRFACLPFGVSVYDKHQIVSLGLTYGLQVQGVTYHQDFVVQTPIRASIHLRVHRRVLINAWASNEFTLGVRRGMRSDNAPGGDELRTGVNLRIGESRDTDRKRGRVIEGSGYTIGVLYAERLETQFWGVSIGYGVDQRPQMQSDN
tara:strand:- start:1192 stop:1896 length:705 start_codon:yes stop_codon:yes gene_type:complete